MYCNAVDMEPAPQDLMSKKAKLTLKKGDPKQTTPGSAKTTDLPSASESITVTRPARARKRPSKFVDYIPPFENKPRAEG